MRILVTDAAGNLTKATMGAKVRAGSKDCPYMGDALEDLTELGLSADYLTTLAEKFKPLAEVDNDE